MPYTYIWVYQPKAEHRLMISSSDDVGSMMTFLITSLVSVGASSFALFLLSPPDMLYRYLNACFSVFSTSFKSKLMPVPTRTRNACTSFYLTANVRNVKQRRGLPYLTRRDLTYEQLATLHYCVYEARPSDVPTCHVSPQTGMYVYDDVY
jgi:hypothetical protein